MRHGSKRVGWIRSREEDSSRFVPQRNPTVELLHFRASPLRNTHHGALCYRALAPLSERIHHSSNQL